MPTKSHFYIIAIPKDNDKGPLVMEQILSSIHGIKEPVSLEIWGTNGGRGKIQFALQSKEFLKTLFESHFPGIDIREKMDITMRLKGKNIFITHLTLKSAPIFPIRRYSQTRDWIKKEWVNPYQAILSPLRKIRNGEMKGIQIILKPLSNVWRKRGMDTLKISDTISSWWIFKRWWSLKDWFINTVYYCWPLRMVFLIMTWKWGGRINHLPDRIDHRGHTQESVSESARSKLSQAGFEVTIRLVYAGSPKDADRTFQEMSGGFAQFNIDELNGFKIKNIVNSKKTFRTVIRRKHTSLLILSVEELAGILTLPDTSIKIPELQKTSFKPMEGTLDEGIMIGKTIIGNQVIKIPSENLTRHAVILGRTGSGKTTFAFNILRELIQSGKGVGIIDPHGDLLDQILEIVPKERIKDTVLINPTDTDYPIAFNPLRITKDRKDQVVSSIVDSMKKIFENSWGPRTDYLLSQSVSALAVCPDGMFLGIPRLLLDESYRKKVLKHIQNPVLMEFWRKEYPNMPARLRAESISPIMNKVNRFLMVPGMRNIIGQKENHIDFKNIMDTEKILLINLSKGVMGEENSALLGSFLLAHLQISVLSRADDLPESRKPFFLFIDELQHFLEKSVISAKTLFTEGRKYKVGIIGACQHISQLQTMADTVFGNAGTIVSFSVGPKDAKLIAEYLQEVEYQDLLNLPLYHAYLCTTVENKPQVISIKNIPPVITGTGGKEKIRKYSRATYARPRAEVENEITEFFQ